MRRAEEAIVKRLNHLNLGSRHQRQTGQSRSLVTWVERAMDCWIGQV